MLNSKAMNGLLNAPPDKRYKSFLNTVADLQEVWLLSSQDGEATLTLNGFIHVLLWPREEFCRLMMTHDQETMPIEVHDFLEKCKKLDNSTRFMVFPTKENSYIVTAEQLCRDIQDHLDEVE